MTNEGDSGGGISRIKKYNNEGEYSCWMCECGAMNDKGEKCYRCGDAEGQVKP